MFFICESNAVGFNASLLSVVGTFMWQVLNEDAGIKGSAEVVATVHAYVSAMDRIKARRTRAMWDAPARLPATQSFLGHVVPFLSNIFKDAVVFEMGRHVTVMESSKK